MQLKSQNKTTPLTFCPGSSLPKSTTALGKFPAFQIIIDISFGIVSLCHYYLMQIPFFPGSWSSVCVDCLASANNNICTIFPVLSTIYFCHLSSLCLPTGPKASTAYSKLLSQQPPSSHTTFCISSGCTTHCPKALD